MDVRRTVGANVRRYRLAADLSQEAIAERMGVDRAYVSGLEVGARNPTIVTLWHMATALGIKVAQLLEEPDGTVEAAGSPRTRARKSLRRRSSDRA